MNRRQFSIAAITGVLLAAAMLVPLPVAASVPQTHTIDVTACQFAFEPATLDIQRGDTVTIHLESLDAAHGLFIDGYDVAMQAEPGKSAQVTSIAGQGRQVQDSLLSFVRCVASVMIGETNVEPDSPFVRAVAATVIAMVGALAFSWK